LQTNDPHIWFTPDTKVNPELFEDDLLIKGGKPLLKYPFSLRDLYPVIPSLRASQAYQKIREEFIRVNQIIHDKLYLRDRLELPESSSDQETLAILSVLFDPTAYLTDGMNKQLAYPGKIYRDTLFSIEHVYPFSMESASPQKLAHSLVWIDTNIKTKLEQMGLSLDIKSSYIVQLAESALKVYCYLVKMDDYTLAHRMNFNFSMFLQDRVLNLLLGDTLFLDRNRAHKRDLLSNQMAAELAKNMGELTYEMLCTMSTFMGVIWTSTDEMQRNYETNPEVVLTNIESQLKLEQDNWCVNHIDQFIKDISTNETGTIVVILDDNGESAIDVALFQKILLDFPMMKIKFIVNSFPISNNISLGIFQTLLDDDFYSDIKQFLRDGRVSLLIEEQVFRSFEIDYIKPETRAAIAGADFTYIKGANFFETFHITSCTRYHCFSVYGPTSIMLTGCAEGNGIFVKITPGQSAFTYSSYSQIRTLRDNILNL
jgi:hypothetical protein